MKPMADTTTSGLQRSQARKALKNQFRLQPGAAILLPGGDVVAYRELSTNATAIDPSITIKYDNRRGTGESIELPSYFNNGGITFSVALTEHRELPISSPQRLSRSRY